MPPPEHEPLELVLGHYAVKVFDIKNESYKGKKGVWWVRTDSGLKILKKTSNSEQTLQFILNAIRHLSGNGILLPTVNKTADGKEYVCIDGICFVLTNAIEGRNPSYSSAGELARIAAELGKFHRASEGFHPSEGTKPKYHLGLWIEDYTRQLEDIKKYYEKEIVQNEHSAIDSVILREFPHFYERASNAIKGLKRTEYADWVREAEKTGCLCHQDFAAGNLIVTPKGDLYVIDTDSLTIDIAARDIRKLLNKVMKKAGKWNMETAKAILNSYQAINPLSRAQWEVVGLDLMFPHLFIGAVNKYIYRREKEWSPDKYLRRITGMYEFEKTAEPVLENLRSIMPV